MAASRYIAFCVTLALAASPAGANPASSGEEDDPSVARVRVLEVRRTAMVTDIVLTGDVQAQAQTNVAFRTSGKVASRLVEVGDHVAADQVLARLDPQEQKANLDNARAVLTSAEALLAQAKVAFRRQEQLLSGGYTTRPAYDNAEQQLRTTQAAVDSAKAALGSAQEQFSYTELRAGVAGILLSRDFETGQVVQAGQTVLVLAQDGPRDAVFNVYEALTAGGDDQRVAIDVWLQSDAKVATRGNLREVAPTVDPASGTVRVKFGLEGTPAAMTLGSVVIGRGRFKANEAVVLPWSALYRWDDGPAVWIYDPKTGAVAPRTVTIDRYGADTIALSGGIEPGESVVSAGIQFLRPGQRVVVAGSGAGRSAP
ncbi:efflux RND transporter periplasmic adaptor subunit [Methylobacterium sp. sgz302541]|uniref:efflux RND transporter periplasmic adaptor subunit n=1 Tax=unclassified Methylobacterium TaxID=2615210 RepID=UPI003D349E28